jgi:hypothetical protein
VTRRIRRQLPVPELYGDPDWERIWCNWDDCENPASSLFKVKVCHAAARHSRHQTCSMCETKPFCCAQHLDFWTRSHLPGQYGKLSAGVNAVFL